MEIVKLNVERREEVGTKACRRLRRQGDVIPAVVYGQNREPMPVKMNQREFARSLHQGNKLFMINAGEGEQLVIVKEVQWDVYGDHVLHVDLGRVSEKDRLTLQVALDFHGESDSPGAKAGGSMELIRNSILVECPAMSIPESLRADVSHLELEQSFRAGDVQLPEGMTLAMSEKLVLLVCHPPKGADSDTPEGEEAEEAPAEAGDAKKEE